MSEIPKNDVEEVGRLAKMKTSFDQAVDRGVDLTHPKMHEFYQEVLGKYSRQECTKCKLWHLIIGSTPNDTVTDFDLPGGEIEDFIKNRLPLIEPEIRK